MRERQTRMGPTAFRFYDDDHPCVGGKDAPPFWIAAAPDAAQEPTAIGDKDIGNESGDGENENKVGHNGKEEGNDDDDDGEDEDEDGDGDGDDRSCMEKKGDDDDAGGNGNDSGKGEGQSGSEDKDNNYDEGNKDGDRNRSSSSHNTTNNSKANNHNNIININIKSFLFDFDEVIATPATEVAVKTEPAAADGDDSNVAGENNNIASNKENADFRNVSIRKRRCNNHGERKHGSHKDSEIDESVHTAAADAEKQIESDRKKTKTAVERALRYQIPDIDLLAQLGK
jgi:hypothetical protein